MLAGMARRVSVEDWARLKFDPAGAPQQREVRAILQYSVFSISTYVLGKLLITAELDLHLVTLSRHTITDSESRYHWHKLSAGSR